MDSLNDEELLRSTGEPDVGVLQSLYLETQNDLGEWADQRQRDYEVRRNIWNGKANDFRKHTKDAETGQVFPFDGAADHEILDIDDHIRTHKALCMNAFRRAQITAMPTEMNDVAQASVVSNYMRWLVQVKMKEFEGELSLGTDNWLEKGLMVHYVYWDQEDRQQLEKFTLEQAAQIFGEQFEQFMTGEMDGQMIQLLQQSSNVSENKARAMIDELRTEGETTIPVTRQIKNQPCIRCLAPDEDFFLPPWTIDPQKAPYAFHVIHMTPEEIYARGKKEEWDEDFIEQAAELSGQGGAYQGDTILNREHTNNADGYIDDRTVRIVYCYQRLLDEDDVPGVYCTIFAYGVPDVYGKHYLLDYAHGDYPFIVTPLERTTKRLYASRSYPEIAASAQQVIKSETDASIDNLSMSTLPPLLHPPGQRPTRWGPGVQVSVFRPDQYQYAPTPPQSGASYSMREEVRMMTNKYFGRNDNEGDPVEIQNKQQDLVENFIGHVRKIMDQCYTLCQQFGPEEEFFRVVGINDFQTYKKGRPGTRYDFWIDFDVTTQDPNQMVERVKSLGELGAMLGKTGSMDMDRLLQIGVAGIMPGAAHHIILPSEQGAQKAMEEERQAIAELMAGVPPDVRENDAHQIKLQFFQQWLQQPDIQQKIAQDEALAQRVENYGQQRQFQIQQDQNAVTGRLGGQSSGFGQTAQV